MSTARQHIPEAKVFANSMVVGQRVLAQFDNWAPKIGVVSGEIDSHSGTVRVQFSPCSGHYSCYRATPQGDRNGWTDREYRIAREVAEIPEHAEDVELERRERYPDSAFSMAYARRERSKVQPLGAEAMA